MKKTAFFSLVFLGCIEIFYGMIWGRLLIKAHEGNFSADMRYTEWTTEQSHVFYRYIRIFKDQWHVLVWFGLFTIIIAFICYFAGERRPETKIE